MKKMVTGGMRLFCRSRLAGDSGRTVDARLPGLIAGKPAPTRGGGYEKAFSAKAGCSSRRSTLICPACIRTNWSATGK
ncbi:hypothetical protein GC387_03695 [Pseudomonas sp. MWU12-2323]|nr:hypothetical protein [Pseudomonas sp. MWU12-2323]